MDCAAGGALDYLPAGEADGRKLCGINFAENHRAAEKREGPRRASRARKKKHQRRLRRATVDSPPRITVIKQCKYTRGGTRGYVCGQGRSEEAKKERRAMEEELSKRNDAPRRARAKRTRVSFARTARRTAPSMCIRVSRAMAALSLSRSLSRVTFTAIDRPSYAPVNVSLYVRYFCFVRRDTRENDGLS